MEKYSNKHLDFCKDYRWGRLFKKRMAPTCEKNVQIKLTPKNFLLIIFNVVYIEVNETRKKL
jgi:hypothetical protein